MKHFLKWSSHITVRHFYRWLIVSATTDRSLCKHDWTHYTPFFFICPENEKERQTDRTKEKFSNYSASCLKLLPHLINICNHINSRWFAIHFHRVHFFNFIIYYITSIEFPIEKLRCINLHFVHWNISRMTDSSPWIDTYHFWCSEREDQMTIKVLTMNHSHFQIDVWRL